MDSSVINFQDLSKPEKAILIQKFYDIVRSIPTGKVATYGQIANKAGRPKDAREVGNALSGLVKTDVPWHRVVLASGKIAMPTRPDLQKRQRELLLEEGVEFSGDYQVYMERYDWQRDSQQGAGEQTDLFG